MNMPRKLDFSPEETELVSQIFNQMRDDQRLQADDAVRVFSGSGLPLSTLSTIWDIVDEGNKGYLLRSDVGSAVRLIGWAQQGTEISLSLLSEIGPLAVFDGLQHPATPNFIAGSANVLSHSPTTGSHRRSASGLPPSPVRRRAPLPPLVPSNKSKYQQVFEQSGPRDGVLPGQRVWQVLSQSQLTKEVLSAIWDLVDTRQCGDLDICSFTVAMYLVHGLTENRLTDVPLALPSWLYEQAGGLPPADHSPERSMYKAFTVDRYSLHPMDLQDEPTGMPVSIAEIAERYFHLLDADVTGFVQGEVAVPFMMLSGLSAQDLAHVWDKADGTGRGYLDKDAFSCMMYIIYQELDRRQGPPLSSLPPLPFPSRQSPRSETERAAEPRTVNNELDQLRNNNRRLRSQSVIQHHSREVSLPEIHDLRQIVHVLKKENAELKRSRTEADTKASGKDVQRGRTEDQHAAELLFDEMWGALKEKDAIISQLRQSHESFQDISRQKLLLHTQVESLKELLHSTKADHNAIQKLLQEDYNREIGELKRQVQELRDAAAPSIHEDQALQAVINQELSKENSSLRTRMDDLVSQLDVLRNELTRLAQSEDGLRRENSELKRQLQEAQGRLSEVEELQRQIEDLRRQNRRLRRYSRGHPSTAVAESEDNPAEVLPSYEEVMA